MAVREVFAFVGFLTLPIAGVSLGVGDRFVLVVSQVLRHRGFKRKFDQSLGQLLQ